MLNAQGFKAQFRLPVFSLLLNLLVVGSAYSTTHIILFGGNLGLTYAPSHFTAQVGDTVQWEGNFTLHPLKSTGIPTGAASWSKLAGTQFLYIIAVPGNYNYHCDSHLSLGMTGSFDVNAIVIEPWPSGAELKTVQLLDATPNPSFYSDILIRFVLNSIQTVSLKLYTVDGRQIATVLQEKRDAGNYNIYIPTRHLSHGAYLCRLTGNTIDTRMLFVAN